MDELYFKIPFLDANYYTNYFLKEFIPNYDVESVFDSYRLAKFSLTKHSILLNDSGIQKLNNDLSAGGFPHIDYFMIFKHKSDQFPHIDGSVWSYDNPHIGINLPLCGYEQTRLIFYKELDNITSITEKTGKFVYDLSHLEEIGSVIGENEWGIINTNVYHRVANINPLMPRYTLSIRLKGNPSFNDLKEVILDGRSHILVPQKRFELSRISARASKARMATITSLGLKFWSKFLSWLKFWSG